MTSTLPTLRRHAGAALSIAAGIFIAIAVFDLVAHPADQGPLHTYKEYVQTATILPAVAAVFWVLAALQEKHASHDGRLGRLGLRVAALGLLALAVDAIVTMASGTTDTSGPLYPVGILATLVGIVLLAVQWDRARAMPRWIGPALAIGWFLGASPILGSGGAFPILAAVFLAIAYRLHREIAAATGPARLDPSVTT
jgi:hypothetical protein